jgi:transposase
MYCNVAQWRRIRHNILEKGMAKREIARKTGISRQTINKMLMHERPPGYSPRAPYYPKLGRYVRAIDRLRVSCSHPAGMTIRNIVKRLHDEEGFTGSYDSVRKYIRRRARDDENTWERAYNVVVRLPKPRAIDFLRLLARGDPPSLMSARFRSFMRESVSPSSLCRRPDRERQRREDMEWMRRVLQRDISDVALVRELDGVQQLDILQKHLHDGRLLNRNRAMVVLASKRKIPCTTIHRNKFDSGGADTLFVPQIKSNRKIDNEDLRSAVFRLLHEPPTVHGINRTSWTMPLLSKILKDSGKQVGPALIGKMIKAAGYKWRKAKVVLTSSDPTYMQKLDRIRSILSNFQPDEAFFSIDEYGVLLRSRPNAGADCGRPAFSQRSLNGGNLGVL